MIQKFFKTTLFYLLFCSTLQIHLAADEKSATPVMAKDGVHIFHGPRGHHGQRGHHGHKGHHGERGHHGKRGKKGKNGVDGPVGAPGATAASACFTPIIGNVAGPAGLSGSTVTFATTLSLVLFNGNGGINFSGGSTFTVSTAGDYLISYELDAQIANGLHSFGVFINGVAAVPDSTVGIQSTSVGLISVLYTFKRIYTLAAGATVEIRVNNVGGGTTPTDGNFLIMKVSS